MKTSESIKEIATAVCKMQAALKPADKDSTNPMYKSKYSDINAVWSVLRGPLTSNGLSVWQDATTLETGVSVITRVVHSSGEWIEFSPYFVPLGVKKDAHGFGSATSYARRYSLCSALGITSDDDDGNALVMPSKFEKPVAAEVPKDMTDGEALQILAEFGNDSVNMLMWMKDRVKTHGTTLRIEMDGLRDFRDPAINEFKMWMLKRNEKKVA